MLDNVNDVKPISCPMWIVGVAVVAVAVISVCLFAGPLNTSVDQEIPAKYQTK